MRLLFIGILTISCLRGEAGDGATVSREVSELDFLQAVDRLVESPLKMHERGDCSIFHEFASSADFHISIGFNDGVTWTKTGIVIGSPTYTLVCAYIAGSLKGQLKSGIRKNDPVEALKLVALVYSTIKKQIQKFEIKELEDISKAARNGKLREYLSDLPRKK